MSGDMVWTLFGFGQRQPGLTPSKSVCVQLKWGKAYLQPKDVHAKVRIQFAAFAGQDLKTWSVDARADEPIEDLRSRAVSDAPVKKTVSVRLVLYGNEIGPAAERICDLDTASRPLPIEILCVLESGAVQEKSLLRDIRNFLASTGAILPPSP